MHRPTFKIALWNSVEKIEKSKKSQLAREIEIAIRHNFLPGCG